MASIPACHAGDRGSIPRRGTREYFLLFERILGEGSIYIVPGGMYFFIYCEHQLKLQITACSDLKSSILPLINILLSCLINIAKVTI